MKPEMLLSMRWYGIHDRVSLRYIAQIPMMRGIVSGLYDIPAGEVWDKSRLKNLKRTIENAGLKFSAVESIPVHEEIKFGGPQRDKLIDAYCQSVRNMGEVGIPVLTYNFMPIFDWMRTDLEFTLPDGSTCLCYIDAALERIDLSEGTGD
ncbi:MAG TPA: mannonate dehydratase, partial [Oligoflexia bacterium]|nr:mannonate dehydratase [Oligoflexia bacterium]